MPDDDVFFPPRFDTPATVLDPTRDSSGIRIYRDIEFGMSIGFRPVRMDLMLPATVPGPASVRVVVYIHGGAFRLGSRRRGPVSAPIWDALLARGIAVATVEYRLSGESLFPACLHDVKAAVRWLRRYGAELGLRPDAIGAWGESAGAYLAAFLGLNTTDPDLEGRVGVTDGSSTVQAVVAWYPPTQFLTMDADAIPDSGQPHGSPDSPESRLIGGPLQEHCEAAAFASPTRHVTADAAPMLLMHGRNDHAVPALQSVHLFDKLKSAGAYVELELIDGADHVFAGVDTAPLVERSATFLADNLGPQR